MSLAGLFSIDNSAPDLSALGEQTVGPIFDSSTRTTELVIGKRNLWAFIPAIRELRLRCGQKMTPQQTRNISLQHTRKASGLPLFLFAIIMNSKPALFSLSIASSELGWASCAGED